MMIKIPSLLNAPPSSNILPSFSSFGRPATRASAGQVSSSTSTPAAQSTSTTTASTTPRQKMDKTAAVFQKGAPKETVHFPPFECTENNGLLTRAQRKELQDQHKKFKIFPSGGEEGLIQDYVRHVPYTSDKKTFRDKTGRQGFDVFQYTFIIPSQPEKEWVVMWDYHNGLVRITPFFKALKEAKTAPSKAIGINEGLREMSHSITGGSIAAQGYWMPYRCALAICATFCWEIRWALTPIFGPSFIQNCLPPTHSNYKNFRIDPEIIRVSAADWDGTAAACTAVNPVDSPDHHFPASATTPRTSPTKNTSSHESPPQRNRSGRPRISTETARPPTTKKHKQNKGHSHRLRVPYSRSISPKTVLRPSPTWTTINTPNATSPDGSPHGMPRPLAEPGFEGYGSTVSWVRAETPTAQRNAGRFYIPAATQQETLSPSSATSSSVFSAPMPTNIPTPSPAPPSSAAKSAGGGTGGVIGAEDGARPPPAKRVRVHPPHPARYLPGEVDAANGLLSLRHTGPIVTAQRMGMLLTEFGKKERKEEEEEEEEEEKKTEMQNRRALRSGTKTAGKKRRASD